MRASPVFRPRGLTRRQALLACAALALGGATRAAFAQSARAAKAILAQASKLTYIAEGDGPRVLWIFFDPNCPFCHQLYGKLRPLVGKDGLQFRWVPLGILTASSLPKAAAILQSPDRLAAFRKNEDDYDFAANGQPGGGILPATTITPAARKELAANKAVYDSQKLFGVPVVVWQRKDGWADMFIGVPSDAQLKDMLASVAG